MRFGSVEQSRLTEPIDGLDVGCILDSTGRLDWVSPDCSWELEFASGPVGVYSIVDFELKASNALKHRKLMSGHFTCRTCRS